MINAQDIKNGTCIRMDGRLYFCIEFLHVKPGKGNTFMRTKLKDVVDGRVLFAAAPSGVRKTVREEDGVILTRGMHAELAPGVTVPALSEEEHANPAAWATHVFRYENTPLEEVLRELSSHFGHALRTDARDRRLTGEFEGEELGEIVSLIESALDIKIVID